LTLHVIFRLAASEYALPVDQVLQMETFSGATPVPGAPPYIAGIVTIRGLVVPVLDLRLRFGLPAIEFSLDTRIVVTRSATRVVGLRVDSAREVLELAVESNQPAPALVNERSKGFVHAVHALGPRLLLLLDLPKVLGENSHDHDSLALLDDAASKRRPALPG
jgi:purine-binding chemotaxis protein CheW